MTLSQDSSTRQCIRVYTVSPSQQRGRHAAWLRCALRLGWVGAPWGPALRAPLKCASCVCVRRGPCGARVARALAAERVETKKRAAWSLDAVDDACSTGRRPIVDAHACDQYAWPRWRPGQAPMRMPCPGAVLTVQTASGAPMRVRPAASAEHALKSGGVVEAHRLASSQLARHAAGRRAHRLLAAVRQIVWTGRGPERWCREASLRRHSATLASEVVARAVVVLGAGDGGMCGGRFAGAWLPGEPGASTGSGVGDGISAGGPVFP
eukprot:CAMPEP_0115854086 /NCGR_PEP_ID=MMETSP0287-20121206/13841_1 /TAXON_ID=412157 /ORGANISM="Chrysochromulina rotalis, Strain UIO044" /LENGTH=265 /DNA_ID=CAMNT_0003308189 /DNA_START=36 /DNA_END=831 /DNA_ORIENTATION=+